MSPDPLTPNQEKVLALIAAGYTATAAAQQAGVHRNTVANWLKSEAFRQALEHSRDEQKLLYWDQAQDTVAEALQNLRVLMYDAAASPTVRLNATKALLHHAMLYLPDKPCLVLPEPEENPAPVHKNAQPPAPERSQPKPGRNDQCPCGSGIKYKRCCINKAEANAAEARLNHQPPSTSH